MSTKKFYWKPGAYKTVQNIAIVIYRILSKAQTLEKIVSRAREQSYGIRNLQTSISIIETKLIDFRRRGVLFQDNTDDIIEYWYTFHNKILEQAQISTDVAVFTVEDRNDHQGNLIDHDICITYTYNSPKIYYRIHGTEEPIGEIECPGIIKITVKLSICKFINIIAGNNGSIDNIPLINLRNQNSAVSIGGNYYNEYGLQHPYIAQHGSSWSNNRNFTEDWKYVCVGNLEEEMMGCIKSLDFLSLKVFMDRLISHYDTQTGPLNRITKTYYGRPNFLEGADDYYNAVGRLRNDFDCTYRFRIRDMIEDDYSIDEIKNEAYCEKYCSLKNKCSIYTQATTEATKEDLERLAIERATINAATTGRIQ